MTDPTIDSTTDPTTDPAAGAVRVVLEAGYRDAEITLRVGGGGAELAVALREELLEALEAEQLRSSRVAEFSAASTLEVLSTSLAGFGPAAGVVALGAAGMQAVPKEAWDALGRALTTWLEQRGQARVEFEYGEGNRVVVEGDRRAVRRVVDDVVLPVVREQQADRHQQWQDMLTGTDADPSHADQSDGDHDDQTPDGDRSGEGPRRSR